MDIDSVSARMLSCFSEIYRTRSVSQAAANLGMSQPGLSTVLARLREHFGDSLFIRTAMGMQPTAHAAQLIFLVDAAREQLRQALEFQSGFDPMRSRRTFTVCMTDIVQLVLLPEWLERRQSEAPNISIDILRMSSSSVQALDDGKIDLALGYMPGQKAGLRERQLREIGFACIASIDHPRIDDAVSIRQFATEPCVVIDCPGSGTQFAEAFLRQRKIERNVVVRVPDFLGIEDIIANSDMIATVPIQVAVYFARHGKVKQLPHPLALPPYAPCARWHERFHLDPGHQWLRRIMVDFWVGIAVTHEQV